MSSELILGLYLSALGMTGVFIVLGCLAGFMWIMGLIQRRREGYQPEEVPKKEMRFSQKELLAIATAIQFYHTLYEEVPEVKSSKGWKEFAKGFQVGGYD